MIIFSRKQFYTGGKGRIPVWRVCADSVDEHERLVAALRAVDKGYWWGSWPTPDDRWEYTDKRQPCVSVRREVLEFLVREHGVFEVPYEYWWFTLVILRREFWREFTDHDDRVIDGKVEAFFRKKLHWLAKAINKDPKIKVDPDLYEPSVWCDPGKLIPGLNLINSWVENFDPGHQNRLNPAVSTLDLDEDVPESVREYLRLNQMDRRIYLTRRPWVLPTLIGRGLDSEVPEDMR